jgi:hypothetical protein
LGEPDFPDSYSTLDAGRDAHERAERKRRQAIDRQVQTIEDIAWYNAWAGSYRYPPSLDSIYAYPPADPIGPGSAVPRAFSRAFRSYPGVYGPVFEPWPFVPGDIWGYPYISRVEQPLGHKVIPTGPNGYIYRPVYASDLKVKQAAQPDPTPPPEQAPEPIPAPAPEAIPAPAAEPGPRVF